jgi:hypothetical protein
MDRGIGSKSSQARYKFREDTMKIQNSIRWFPAFARWAANVSGKPVTFGIAVLTVII